MKRILCGMVLGFALFVLFVNLDGMEYLRDVLHGPDSYNGKEPYKVAAGLKEKAVETYDKTKEGGSRLIEGAKHGAEKAVDRTKEGFRRTAEWTREGAHEVVEKTKRVFETTKKGVEKTVEWTKKEVEETIERTKETLTREAQDLE